MGQLVLLPIMIASASLETTWAGVNVWTSLGPDGGGARSLVIDPPNPDTVYALTTGGRCKSTDGGPNWTLRPPLPLNSGVVGSLVIAPRNPSVLYATRGPNARGPPRELILKSTDGGSSWRPLTSVLSGGFPAQLVIDPQDSNTLYAHRGFWGPRGGVYQSRDGGESSTAVNFGLPRDSLNFMWVDIVAALVIDPHNTGTLYAATSANWVYRTTDGGETWNAVNSGLTTMRAFALAVDPRDSGTIYAGTAGGVFTITFAAQ